MQQLLRMIDRVAKHNAAVLLVGETGSGKEVIAQTIHARSNRANKQLIDINCAALPDHLVESELFGYEKSAFSGADQMKQGLFELANGGTLFLDEIGELDIQLQSKLLRVLDGQPYFRLGGNRKVDVNVRLVAATNRDLKQEIERGRFRADLYHRIAQFQIIVPPLRERKEDIPVIAQELLSQQRRGARFTEAALNLLLSHTWPGNVRELKNVVLRASVATESPVVDVCDIDLMLPNAMAAAASASVSFAGYQAVPSAKENVKRLEHMERTAILTALKDCGGHQGKTAEKLGISRRTLTRKLKEYRDEFGSTAMGILSREQQEYFRADLDSECAISWDLGDGVGRLRNVSATGVAVHEMTSAPAENDIVSIEFILPDGALVQAQCRVAWSEGTEAGLQFTGATPSPLAAWLTTQQALEGWTPETSKPSQPISRIQ